MGKRSAILRHVDSEPLIALAYGKKVAVAPYRSRMSTISSARVGDHPSSNVSATIFSSVLMWRTRDAIAVALTGAAAKRLATRLTKRANDTPTCFGGRPSLLERAFKPAISIAPADLTFGAR